MGTYITFLPLGADPTGLALGTCLAFLALGAGFSLGPCGPHGDHEGQRDAGLCGGSGDLGNVTGGDAAHGHRGRGAGQTLGSGGAHRALGAGFPLFSLGACFSLGPCGPHGDHEIQGDSRLCGDGGHLGICPGGDAAYRHCGRAAGGALGTGGPGFTLGTACAGFSLGAGLALGPRGANGDHEAQGNAGLCGDGGDLRVLAGGDGAHRNRGGSACGALGTGFPLCALGTLDALRTYFPLGSGGAERDHKVQGNAGLRGVGDDLWEVAQLHGADCHRRGLPPFPLGTGLTALPLDSPFSLGPLFALGAGAAHFPLGSLGPPHTGIALLALGSLFPGGAPLSLLTALSSRTGGPHGACIPFGPYGSSVSLGAHGPGVTSGSLRSYGARVSLRSHVAPDPLGSPGALRACHSPGTDGARAPGVSLDALFSLGTLFSPGTLRSLETGDHLLLRERVGVAVFVIVVSITIHMSFLPRKRMRAARPRLRFPFGGGVIVIEPLTLRSKIESNDHREYRKKILTGDPIGDGQVSKDQGEQNGDNAFDAEQIAQTSEKQILSCLLLACHGSWRSQRNLEPLPFYAWRAGLVRGLGERGRLSRSLQGKIKKQCVLVK